jgi:hypothetical protein
MASNAVLCLRPTVTDDGFSAAQRDRIRSYLGSAGQSHALAHVAVESDQVVIVLDRVSQLSAGTVSTLQLGLVAALEQALNAPDATGAPTPTVRLEAVDGGLLNVGTFSTFTMQQAIFIHIYPGPNKDFEGWKEPFTDGYKASGAPGTAEPRDFHQRFVITTDTSADVIVRVLTAVRLVLEAGLSSGPGDPQWAVLVPHSLRS